MTVPPHIDHGVLRAPSCRYCGVNPTEIVAAVDRLVLVRCPSCELHWVDDTGRLGGPPPVPAPVLSAPSRRR